MADSAYDRHDARPLQSAFLVSAAATRRSSGSNAPASDLVSRGSIPDLPNSAEKKAQAIGVWRSTSYNPKASLFHSVYKLRAGCRSNLLLLVPFILVLLMIILVIWEQAKAGRMAYLKRLFSAEAQLSKTLFVSPLPHLASSGILPSQLDLAAEPDGLVTEQGSEAGTPAEGDASPSENQGNRDEHERSGQADAEAAQRAGSEAGGSGQEDSSQGSSHEESQSPGETAGSAGTASSTAGKPETHSQEPDTPSPVLASPQRCNLFEGRWVRDAALRAPYSGRGCKWLAPNWACRRSHRPRFAYEKMRWQPDGCDLPRFDAQRFLSSMRHRQLAFFGDSLGQQMFQSLLCLLAPKGPPADMRKRKAAIRDVGASSFGFYLPEGSRKPTGWAYRFAATNTTLVFRWSSFLCRAAPTTEAGAKGALHLDQPDDFLREHFWEFDVIIMNTGHHWNRVKVNEANLEFFVNGSRAPVTRRGPMQVGDAHALAVRAVARWVDEQLAAGRGRAEEGAQGEGGAGEEGQASEGAGRSSERRRRLLEATGAMWREGAVGGRGRPVVFLRTMSPRHFMEGEWNTGGKCDHLKSIFRPSELAAQKVMQRDLKAEAAAAGTALRLLNITRLSAFRGEAHPAKWDYRLAAGQEPRGQDCLHWCLPGVPDTWNAIVLAQLGEAWGAGRGGAEVR